MKIRFGPNSLNISFGDGSIKKESQRATPDQQHPKGFYVYGHYDAQGSLFYVGKGTGRRAWSSEGRHDLWTRYVQRNLAGIFDVKIIADGMSDDEAEEYEARLITDNGDALVNWVNMGRSTDWQLGERCAALRNANRQFIHDTKAAEKVDREAAIKNYKIAIEKAAEYAFMDTQGGLVGQLLTDECDELGRCGEPLALERLTMCLIKLGRVDEAVDVSAAYFSRYKRDLETGFAARVKTRIEKALRVRSLGNTAPSS